MKDKLEDFPGLLVCSQVACQGIKDRQLKASGSRTALVLDGLLQAQAGSLVRCCGSSYRCPRG